VVGALEGSCTPEVRQRRETLSVSRPCIEAALQSLDIDPELVASVRRFGNQLAAEAERWKLRGGFRERGRINKADASRMFAQAFPATAIVMAASRRERGR
jgi:hypothetical protein